MSRAPAVQRELRLDRPLDLDAILQPLRSGRDPSWRRIPGGWAKATRTPPVWVWRSWRSTGLPGCCARAHGATAPTGWLSGCPRWSASATTTAASSRPRSCSAPGASTGVAGARHRAGAGDPGPGHLGPEGHWQGGRGRHRRLLLALGEPVGFGPWPDLLAPPEPRRWATVPSWQRHRAGVGPERSRAVVVAAGRAEAIERLCRRPRPTPNGHFGRSRGSGCGRRQRLPSGYSAMRTRSRSATTTSAATWCMP